MRRTIEISCEICVITENAVMIFDGDEEHWIPKQYIEDVEDLEVCRGKAVEVEMAEWIAIKKGLV